jgi:flagellar biosynthesis/type III secretory pathway protein FliH
LLKVRPKLREGFKILLKEEPMLEIPPFTIEELKDLPFTAKAIEQLEQEAILKGLEKGKQEGLQEGLVKAKKDDVKSAILIKFKVLPKELEEKIETTDDIKALDEMFKKVILAGNIEEIL